MRGSDIVIWRTKVWYFLLTGGGRLRQVIARGGSVVFIQSFKSLLLSKKLHIVRVVHI